MRNGELGSLTQTLAELRDRVGQANDQVAATGSVDELQAAVLDVQFLASQVEALKVALAGRAIRAGIVDGTGTRTVKQFVAAESPADPKDVAADVRLATWLLDFAEFEQAFADRTILRPQLELIRQTAHNSRTHMAMVAQQQFFIEAAKTCTYRDFKTVVRYWILAADVDGEEPRDQIAKTRFSAHRQDDGTVKIDGYLDPLSGATFLTAFEAAQQAVFRADSQNDVKRSHGQRGAAAILGLVEKGSRQKNGKSARPLFGVVLGENAAEDLLARIGTPSVEPFAIDPFDIDGRCELLDGTPIHPHFALAAMAIADFQRHIMNAESRTVDVSIKARCFNNWQKHALLVEARGRCQTRGCEAPFPWLQADHIVAHTRGGQTKMSNGKILCDPDNKHKRDKPAA